MFTQYPNGAVSCSACVRAIDLIRIADQLMKDNMQFAQITVSFDENIASNSNYVKISAIPSATSDDVKTYPKLKSLLAIDIDDEEY